MEGNEENKSRPENIVKKTQTEGNLQMKNLGT